MELVPSFLALLQQVSFVRTAPTFDSFVIVVTGWLFYPPADRHRRAAGGRRGRPKHPSAFHRFLAAARWSLDELGLAVLGLILPWAGAGPVWLALDDTRARKRGLKIHGVGRYQDPLLSTRKTALASWGHRWVILRGIVRLPFRPAAAQLRRSIRPSPRRPPNRCSRGTRCVGRGCGLVRTAGARGASRTSDN